MSFMKKLEQSWQKSDSLLCIGLDPDMNKLPETFKDQHNAFFNFNKAIIDNTHDLVCAFKPQMAYFSSESAEQQLEQTIQYIKTTYPHIPVILDAKRGDIGSTATMYAREAFERYNADAVTINPYMGSDSAQPFLQYQDRGVILLCRTSNSGARDIQDLEVSGQPLYEKVASLIANEWNTNRNCLLVVGATWPSQMARIRSLVGNMPFLVPGVGTQGGDVEAIIKAGQTSDGTGLIISSSRAILYADASENFAHAARAEALRLRDEINQYRHHCSGPAPLL